MRFNEGKAGADVLDLSAPNASKHSYVRLPVTDLVPPELSVPSGGLTGNVSDINVNEGTDDSHRTARERCQWSGDSDPRQSVLLRRARPVVYARLRSIGACVSFILGVALLAGGMAPVAGLTLAASLCVMLRIGGTGHSRAARRLVEPDVV